MNCHECGRPNAADANFCTGCGARLRSDPEAETRALPLTEPSLPDADADLPIRPAQPLLLVRRGPNIGSRYSLAPGSTTIGRDGAATIFLNDITVSRRHATIENDGTHCMVIDENSLNGTYLNGRRIESRDPLDHGDELQIGLFRIVYLEPRPDGETAARTARSVEAGFGRGAAGRPQSDYRMS